MVVLEIWYGWAPELFCDAAGFVIGGPVFMHAFSSYLSNFHPGDYYAKSNDLQTSSHPISWLRITLLAKRVADSGFPDLAKETMRKGQSVANAMGVVEDYHGYYYPALEGAVSRTIEDMLVVSNPRSFTLDEVAGDGWLPEEDTPMRLLNWAWQVYLATPDEYGRWKSRQLRRLLTTPVSASE